MIDLFARADLPLHTIYKKNYSELRSARWFATDDLHSFGHRSRIMQLGYGPQDWEGKPVIAILNTWSDIGTCHGHFKQRVEDVKRGVLQADGFLLELPALSLSESMVKPTTMLYRNMLTMETEELLRSHPIDSVVLMGGCDKTTPGQIMGAILALRRSQLKPQPKRFERGYGWMAARHIRQADTSCDFNFLETSFGAPVGEPDMY